ncbi:MAG: type II secretion system protein [Candidatus Riflebacteria bacterium]|nr:type II secretion system protein [Candidatus Riflebacteria bacterium]
MSTNRDRTFGSGKKNGFTLVEILVTALVLALIFSSVLMITRFLLGKKTSSISEKISLQIESRRAIINLFAEVQEGIELLAPLPGQTLPYMVIRDYVNNLHFIYLKKNENASAQNKRPIYTLYSSIHDTEKSVNQTPKELLKNVERLTFTSHGFSGVVVCSTLREGSSVFSFVNMIRLKNTQSEDSL